MNGEHHQVSMLSDYCCFSFLNQSDTKAKTDLSPPANGIQHLDLQIRPHKQTHLQLPPSWR